MATLMTSFFNLPLLIEVQSWLSPFLLSVSSERCVDHRTQRHCRQVTRGVGAGGHGSATGHKNTGATWEVKSSSEAVVWFHKLDTFQCESLNLPELIYYSGSVSTKARLALLLQQLD